MWIAAIPARRGRAIGCSLSLEISSPSGSLQFKKPFPLFFSLDPEGFKYLMKMWIAAIRPRCGVNEVVHYH